MVVSCCPCFSLTQGMHLCAYLTGVLQYFLTLLSPFWWWWLSFCSVVCLRKWDRTWSFYKLFFLHILPACYMRNQECAGIGAVCCTWGKEALLENQNCRWLLSCLDIYWGKLDGKLWSSALDFTLQQYDLAIKANRTLFRLPGIVFYRSSLILCSSLKSTNKLRAEALVKSCLLQQWQNSFLLPTLACILAYIFLKS